MTIKRLFFVVFAGLLALAPCFARNYDADIIVVGSGLGGHAATYSALENGATVIWVEKNPVLGGSTAIATGTFPAAGTTMQKERGIEDSNELFIQDLNRIGHNKADQNILRAFVEKATSVWEWFVKGGFQVDTKRGPFIDPVHSAYSVPRTYVPSPNKSSMYTDFLYAKMEPFKSKLTIRLNTKAESLVVEKGRVSGVLVVSDQGTEVLRAKAVILATGGYGSNRDMIKRYSPKYSEVMTVTLPFATGDGHRMAAAVGADLVNMDYICAYFGGMPKAPGQYAIGFGDLSSGAADGWKGEIWVNQRGERFINEDDGDEDPREMALNEQPDLENFIIFDQGMVDFNKRFPIGGFEKRLEENGYAVKKADTIEELCKAFGLPVAQVKREIAAVNGDHSAGKTDRFGKKPAIGFTKGPYYGILNRGTIFMTQGGIRTDIGMRVLDKNGRWIPGLYAAGEAQGTSQWGGLGMAGGTGNAPPLVFGMEAGKNAVNEAKLIK
ncbi:MAG: FAD-dependent oxidoreductase [Spirochaetia bacterium]|jgi:flavocytochrome c|uniref:Putative Urocanate reductase n=1 Tax=uncultured Spirochaetota bacterium TaxID=460511 RepID=A0A652ZWK4_9SPIR|nr:FAD-dependent oxidoreductase [Spirochaetia bacterium]VBB40172.1 putative Urocanate reductase [uncultured Spirochaetota bacterium]